MDTLTKALCFVSGCWFTFEAVRFITWKTAATISRKKELEHEHRLLVQEMQFLHGHVAFLQAVIENQLWNEPIAQHGFDVETFDTIEDLYERLQAEEKAAKKQFRTYPPKQHQPKEEKV